MVVSSGGNAKRTPTGGIAEELKRNTRLKSRLKQKGFHRLSAQQNVTAKNLTCLTILWTD